MNLRTFLPRAWMVVAFGQILVAGITASAWAHGPVQEEIGYLSAQIARFPADPALYLRRAQLERLDQRWSAAEEDLRRAETLDPGNPSLAFFRARLFLDSGRPGPAKNVLDRVLARDPASSGARLMRARALAALGRLPDAVQDLEVAAMSSRRPTPELFVECARLIAAQGDECLADAIEVLDQGLERLGPAASLEDHAMELELKLRRYDAALARLDGVMIRADRREALLIRRAEILEAAGRRMEALATYTDALAALEALSRERRSSRAIAFLEARARAALTESAAATETPAPARARGMP